MAAVRLPEFLADFHLQAVQRANAPLSLNSRVAERSFATQQQRLEGGLLALHTANFSLEHTYLVL